MIVHTEFNCFVRDLWRIHTISKCAQDYINNRSTRLAIETPLAVQRRKWCHPRAYPAHLFPTNHFFIVIILMTSIKNRLLGA